MSTKGNGKQTGLTATVNFCMLMAIGTLAVGWTTSATGMEFSKPMGTSSSRSSIISFRFIQFHFISFHFISFHFIIFILLVYH